MLYNQFVKHIKNFLLVGWIPGDKLIKQGDGKFKIKRTGVEISDLNLDGFQEIIDFFKFILTQGDMEPEKLMDVFKIPSNIGIFYCQYILSSTEKIYKKYDKNKSYDSSEIYNIHFCIGDFTEKLSLKRKPRH